MAAAPDTLPGGDRQGPGDERSWEVPDFLCTGQKVAGGRLEPGSAGLRARTVARVPRALAAGGPHARARSQQRAPRAGIRGRRRAARPGQERRRRQALRACWRPSRARCRSRRRPRPRLPRAAGTPRRRSRLVWRHAARAGAVTRAAGRDSAAACSTARHDRDRARRASPRAAETPRRPLSSALCAPGSRAAHDQEGRPSLGTVTHYADGPSPRRARGCCADVVLRFRGRDRTGAGGGSAPVAAAHRLWHRAPPGPDYPFSGDELSECAARWCLACRGGGVYRLEAVPASTRPRSGTWLEERFVPCPC